MKFLLKESKTLVEVEIVSVEEDFQTVKTVVEIIQIFPVEIHKEAVVKTYKTEDVEI